MGECRISALLPFVPCAVLLLSGLDLTVCRPSLRERGGLSPSSLGLQSWSVILLRNDILRRRVSSLASPRLEPDSESRPSSVA
eukprot:m.344775 g.344775  ORF g.344775 m.344775 type:complete len:83 (-) comp27886_c0_seq4:2536-2784(-)